ncbi:tautomerase family protein [Nitrogeniibacter aestuarii]|uniref:tautomerase family protein n=1 Tax=Nitrogeniibacter aestuarii TaxID=2815343 RepID=UPI001E51BBD8|nr:tautomerase family protein [Nitrogeniibacter aestuarii]
MAIVRIDFSQHQSEQFGQSVSEVVHRTMQTVLGVPPSENFIVCQRYPEGSILHAPGECPPERLDRIVFIQITLNLGRSAELKNQFFAELSDSLVATVHLDPQNIYINLVEVARENWSFGYRLQPAQLID